MKWEDLIASIDSALSEACAGGDVETIKFFLDNGAFINKLAHFHRTPIFRASFGGHLDAVKVSTFYHLSLFTVINSCDQAHFLAD